jgi:hypothetical protein
MKGLHTWYPKTLAISLIVLGAGCSPSPPTSAPAETKAQKESDAESAASLRSLCKSYSQLAAEIMRGRQGGVAMSASMDTADKSDPDQAKIIRRMIMEAYEKPRMSTEQNQQRMVTDFENDTYLSCVQASER